MQTPAQCGVVSLTHFLEQPVTDITACNLAVCTGHILRTTLEGEREGRGRGGEGEGERGRGEGEGERGRGEGTYTCF